MKFLFYSFASAIIGIERNRGSFFLRQLIYIAGVVREEISGSDSLVLGLSEINSRAYLLLVVRVQGFEYFRFTRSEIISDYSVRVDNCSLAP
jgi:hypothetical protein